MYNTATAKKITYYLAVSIIWFYFFASVVFFLFGGRFVLNIADIVIVVASILRLSLIED